MRSLVAGKDIRHEEAQNNKKGQRPPTALPRRGENRTGTKNHIKTIKIQGLMRILWEVIS